MSFVTIIHRSGLQQGVNLNNLHNYPAQDGAFYALLGVDCDEPNLHLHSSADIGRCWVDAVALWVRRDGAWVNVGLDATAASQVAYSTREKQREFLIKSALDAGGRRDLPRCSALAPHGERDKQLRETECVPLLQHYATHGTKQQRYNAAYRLLANIEISKQVPVEVQRQIAADHPDVTTALPTRRRIELGLMSA